MLFFYVNVGDTRALCVLGPLLFMLPLVLQLLVRPRGAIGPLHARHMHTWAPHDALLLRGAGCFLLH